ncbi:MAG: HEAT repeat domain-containing protein [Elusimicrobiota bacterium]
MRKLDDEEFLSLWEEAATSNDLELREFAISAEARKRWDSHPPISKLLKDISDPKRDPALRIDLMRYLQSPNTRRSIIKMQAVEEAISTLVAIARSTEPNAVREAALAASGSIGLHAYEVDELKGKADADLRKVLLAHLEDDKEAGVIRGRAAVLLSRFRDPRAVAPMALAAKDQSLHSAQFLERIASSLGFYDKDSQALEALERLLDNPNVAIRREVIRSLEKIGSPKARRRVDQLQETERDKSVLRLIGELREKRKR